MMIGLGETCTRVYGRTSSCPAGYRMEVSTYCPPYSGACYEQRYCCAGEPWYCEWFGVGCRGVEPPPLPAPQTREQMSVPGAWTPEMSAQAAAEQYRAAVGTHLEHTSGVAVAPAVAYESVESAGEFLGSRTTWMVMGVALGIAALIAVRRL